MTWLEGKKTIITAVLVGLFNLLRMFFPDTPILSSEDVAIAITVVGTILITIFRLVAKPKPVTPPTP
jgi:uncharacterized MnhB-related membrane protein